MKISTTSRSPLRWLTSIIGITALASIALAGCTAQVTGVQKASQQTFIYPNAGGPNAMPLWDAKTGQTITAGLALDPAFAGDLYSQTVLTMTQIQLFTLDNNQNLLGDAAKSWDHSADGKTWTIHLRPGLFWSDGTPLQAEDFKAGMLHDLDPKTCLADGPFVSPVVAQRGTGCQAQALYLSAIQGANYFASGKDASGKPVTDVSGIQVVDHQTLVFTLTQAVGFFLDQLATMASMPIESSALARFHGNYALHYTDNVSESGPFRISAWASDDPNVSDPQHATKIIMVPNPHWWGKAVQLQQVIMPLLNDQQGQYNRYTTQDSTKRTDFTLVPPSDYPFVENLSDFHEVRALRIDFYAMNFANPPFDNLEVRQALELALNKQYLVDTNYQGSALPTNHIIPDGILGYNPSLVTPPNANLGSASLTGSQALAKQLISHVAQGCASNATPDWCKYIIGVKGANTSLQPITKIGAQNSNCPSYSVLATPDANGNYTSTQQQIVSYAPIDRLSRDSLNKGAVAQWANILCLNIVTNDAINKSITGQQLIRDVYGTPDQGMPSPEGLFSLGYGADYSDPQDFTSNQFSPNNGGNGNNAMNFAVKSAADNDNLAKQNSIVADMNQADITIDPAKRIQLYQQIEQELVFQVAWLPLDQPKIIYRLQPYVMNFTMPATGYVGDQSWSDVFIAAHN